MDRKTAQEILAAVACCSIQELSCGDCPLYNRETTKYGLCCKPWTEKEVVEAVKVMNEQPAADVAPVVRGRWENYPSDAYRRCTACKTEFEKARFSIRANFCPNCGARMEG